MKLAQMETPHSFYPWLRNQKRKWLAVLLLFPGLTTLLGLVPQLKELIKQLESDGSLAIILSDEFLLTFIATLQALVIFILLFCIPNPSSIRAEAEVWITERPGRSYAAALDTAESFRKNWANVWTSWGLFYVVLTVLSLHPSINMTSIMGDLKPLLNLLNNITTSFLISCYFEIGLPSRTPQEQRRLHAPLLGFRLFVVILFLMEILGQQRGSDLLVQLCRWTGSIAQGVLLALIVGRLDSKYVSPPIHLTTLLYVYAVIQGPFALFGVNAGFTLAFFSLAFLLKVLLFLIVAWVLDSGVLIFYLAEMRWLHVECLKERAQFVLAYSSGKTSES